MARGYRKGPWPRRPAGAGRWRGGADFFQDHQVARLGDAGQRDGDDLVQRAPQPAQRARGGLRLCGGAFAFLRHRPAAGFYKGQQVFGQHRQLGYRAGQGEVVFLAVGGVLAQFLGAGFYEGHAL